MTRLSWPSTIFQASKAVLSSPKEVGRLFVIAVTIFFLFVLLPVLTTPGNDIVFQLSITPPSVFVLMTILSLLNGLLITTQLKLRREHRDHPLTGKEATTIFGMIVSAFAATVACAACYSSVLALFGLGGTIFLVTHRWWFAVIALVLTLYALTQTSKQLLGVCKVCKM